jgi:transcriptional regulator with XRE-family HTH domain
MRTYVRVAHPTYIREKARQLRRDKHLTIDELAERLVVSRTTAYYWVRDLPIPITAAQSLAQRRASKSTRRQALALREAAYAEGLKWFAFFSVDPLFRDFVCMYIGEGYKRCRNTVAICNSDPAVLRLAKPWFDLFSRNPITLSVQYHADQSLSGVQAFWGAELGVSPSSVKLQRKSNSGRLSGRVWRSEHGVLAMSVGDTYFRAELQAWMDCIRDEWH